MSNKQQSINLLEYFGLASALRWMVTPYNEWNAATFVFCVLSIGGLFIMLYLGLKLVMEFWVDDIN